jgi:hypothetical protein
VDVACRRLLGIDRFLNDAALAAGFPGGAQDLVLVPLDFLGKLLVAGPRLGGQVTAEGLLDLGLGLTGALQCLPGSPAHGFNASRGPGRRINRGGTALRRGLRRSRERGELLLNLRQSFKANLDCRRDKEALSTYGHDLPRVPAAVFGVFVLQHRGGVLAVIVIAAIRPSGNDPLEVTLQVIFECPHPPRRHVLLRKVFLPRHDRRGIGENECQVGRNVFYAVTIARPESSETSTSEVGSDEFEDAGLAGESFPSIRLTVRATHCCSRNWRIRSSRSSTSPTVPK